MGRITLDSTKFDKYANVVAVTYNWTNPWQSKAKTSRTLYSLRKIVEDL